jgi:hypothetical protein
VELAGGFGRSLRREYTATHTKQRRQIKLERRAMAEPPVPESQQENPSRAEPSAAAASGYLSAAPLNAALFALAGGAIAWTVLYAWHPMFGVPGELRNSDNLYQAALAKANRDNAMLALSVVGALVGGSLGIAEQVARRSPSSARWSQPSSAHRPASSEDYWAICCT